jgi:hypothetical protein
MKTTSRMGTEEQTPIAPAVGDVSSPSSFPVPRRVWLSLALAVVFVLVGVATGQDGKDKEKDKDSKSVNLGANKDLPLVERLLAARREYQLTMEALRKHYISVGDLQRARWAEEELLQFHRILKQVFIMALDVPPPTLKGSENIPQANLLFRQAKGYKDKGWGTDYIDNQRRAELLFQRILTEHPRSDKISDTAYQLGDIYESRAFQQYARSAVYFERCYQWNPKTQHDARMRAARLYERQLNDRGKAAAIYKEITTHETDDRRIDEARRKMQELSNRR